MANRKALSDDPIAEARRLWVEHGWEDAAAGMAAVTSLMRAQQIAMARVDEVLRPMGLTFARYEVLMLLSFSRRGALPMGRIGGRLQVHPTSVTNAVDRLESAGLVRRRPDPRDGRARLVELTAAGRRKAATATERLNAEVFADIGLPPAEVSGIVELLTDYRRAAGDFDG